MDIFSSSRKVKSGYSCKIGRFYAILSSLPCFNSLKLGSDQTLVPASKPFSAAALKSVQILSKFWRDEVNEGDDHNFEALVSSIKTVDPKVIQKWATTPILTHMVMPATVMDESLNHDKWLEVEEDNAKAIETDFKQHHPILSESTKEVLKKKKKHQNKVKPASFNSAGMKTRA